MRSLLTGTLLLLWASACHPEPPVTSRAAVDDLTALGPGDTFDVRVYGEEDLSATYRVAQDGTIDFPFVGRIHVEGREPTEVADAIAVALRDGEILVAPQVSVLIKESESRVVSVMGAVASSGTFPMRSGLTVVQAISLAGGFSPLANRNETVVTRRVNGELKRHLVRVDDISRGRAEDFLLRSGDIVFVPERLF
ncbi:MAG: polysaccharide biosynthesis protein [Sandaracinus sp.]|nr:polysaccharide biosynthesis protein [Sandaracinus sp.]|tara:strand:+ start:2774 stop:3358 length:585 start_codon:yes stop_codon:yes gene_type:complete